MKKSDCTPEQWAAYLVRKAQERRARRAVETPEQRAARLAKERKGKPSKRKTDYTPEQWAKRLARQRERVKSTDPNSEAQKARREYMKNYLKKYVQTPKAKAYDKGRQHDPARREKQIAAARKKMYGLDRETAVYLLQHQKDKCAVCGRLFEGGRRELRPNVDHCHDTNSIRGFLCLPCNLAEGYIKATGLSPSEFAERLEAYLDAPPAVLVKSAMELVG